MEEKLITGPEPSEKQETEKGIMEEAHDRTEKLKSELEKWRQEVKAKGRSLFGLDLPHAENGRTLLPPLPSEVPPRETTETIPSSYVNLPIETSVPSNMPATVGPRAPAEGGEGQTPNPEPAKRVVGKIIAPKEIPSTSSASTDIQPQGPIPVEEKNELLPDFHTVQAGETLYGIAKKFNMGLGNLLGINGLDENSTIEINQKIRLKPGIKIKPEQKELPPLPDFHTVVKGDTLSSIAKRYGGLALADLYIFNGLDAKSTLQIGQILALKNGVKLPEQEKKPEEEKKLAEGLTRKEHTAIIKAACENLEITDRAQIAYILATAEHESAYFGTMHERGKGALKKYGKKDEETGQIYYGRGYVQLTWRDNYEKFVSVLNKNELTHGSQNIVNNPDLVTQPKIAAFILVHGMKEGLFCNKKDSKGNLLKDSKGNNIPEKLGDYINKDNQDWFNARNIINGDKNKNNYAGIKIGTKIANEAQEILKTL